MLTVITFKWNSPVYRVRYDANHVNVLEAMVRRHYDGDLRFICVTDDPVGVHGETFPLWQDCGELFNASGRHLPSCYRRLKLFDPATQAALGIKRGERLVSIDLDVMACGPLNPLWDREEPFVGWAVRGSYHPRVFNGSMWLLQAGREAQVWRLFDPDKSPAEAHASRYLGSDQSWISYRLKGRAGWTAADGVYSYPLSLAGSDELPANARMVIFHGQRKPWSDRTRKWVAEHYRMAPGGRCLVLGYAPSVWDEADRAMAARDYDGIIASPEVAEVWPGPVTAVAASDDEAVTLAQMLGFDDIEFCGRTIPAEIAA